MLESRDDSKSTHYTSGRGQADHTNRPGTVGSVERKIPQALCISQGWFH